MVKRLELSHDYAADPATVWALATDFAALGEVNKPYIRFRALPEGRCEAGQKLSVDVSLFGIFPYQPYHMEVVEMDETAHVLQSSETGAGVKSWRHRLSVEPRGTGARLCDVIEIDAGWMTSVFLLWARLLYGNRHRHRLRLLGESAAGPAASCQ